MIIDDYIEYSNKYKEKYGQKCLILMQVGSFYELYSITDDTSNEIYTVADLCNIQVSKKNKNIQEVSLSNPLMAGFPLYTIKKFTSMLLNANYTIVLVEQVSEPPNPERKITEILSPGMNINVENKNTNYMMVLYFEFIDDLPVVGIAGIDLSTGKCFVYETGTVHSDPEFTNDEVFRIISSYNPREIVILSETNYDEKCKQSLLKNLNISSILVHYIWDSYEYISQMKNITYQKSVLNKAFISENNLSVTESLNLEKLYYCRISLCCLIQFAYEHNVDIIKKLNKPYILNNEKFMNIEYNSATQLNLIELNNTDTSLLYILNRCSTSFGSRFFKEQFLKPIIDEKTLNKKYDDIEYVLQNNLFKDITNHLSKVLDIERMKRKMIINKFHPQDWCGFHTSLENILCILKILCHSPICSYDTETICMEIMNDYITMLDLTNASKYNLNDIKGNIFHKGVFNNLDELTDEFDNSYKIIDNINKQINEIGVGDSTLCKIDFSEKDGFFLSITKKRFDTAKLQSKTSFLEKFQIKSQSVASNLKITNVDITNASNKMEDIQYQLSRDVQTLYQSFVSDFISKHENNLNKLISIISEIDITCCNARNAFEYRYYKPSIKQHDSSFVSAKNMRHPIVERLNNSTHYIGNDITISSENENGILLYGINASGKSSFMKSIGLNIIMAQCGMYVPATHFEYYPYRHIFTRISGADNIFKGMSSFTVEMTELRNILQRCDKYSLVLGDEVCSGTEATSALAIVAAALDTMVKKKTSFVFATHLHELTDVEIVKKHISDYIRVCHIHITIDDKNNIIYERKLKEGKGLSTYGIEVCKSLDLPSDFMKTAEMVRKQIQGYGNMLVSLERSRYNNELFMSECKICHARAEDTHHIMYQCQSNTDGYFETFHKNNINNLIPLCKSCHDKEHNGMIKIKGYKQSSKGIIVDVENMEDKIQKVVENEISEDDYSKIKQYIKRGKCSWFSRTTKTNVFKKMSNISNLSGKINKILKKNVVCNISELENILYDPSL